MRVADFIVARLNHLGVDTAFLVTGGGAMYLNDAIGADSSLQKVYCHHEQGAAIASEAYARVALKPALLNVTTGPGSINALNGVFGAFTDSWSVSTLYRCGISDPFKSGCCNGCNCNSLSNV